MKSEKQSMIDWSCIERFIGYGNLDAPVVFVGMEEGLPSVKALSEDLLFRSRFAPVMDAELAHRGLAKGPRLFSDKPRRQPTWRVMADVMLHYEAVTFTSDKERARARKSYRATRLGSEGGDSLLMELLPYPNKNKSTWLYSERFPNRDDYVAHVLPERLHLLSTALQEHESRAIICYGHDDWKYFKALFPEDTRWIPSGVSSARPGTVRRSRFPIISLRNTSIRTTSSMNYLRFLCHDPLCGCSTSCDLIFTTSRFGAEAFKMARPVRHYQRHRPGNRPILFKQRNRVA